MPVLKTHLRVRDYSVIPMSYVCLPRIFLNVSLATAGVKLFRLTHRYNDLISNAEIRIKHTESYLVYIAQVKRLNPLLQGFSDLG